VRLVAAAQKRREPRRPSQDERQQARGPRIERAGVADASFARRAPQPRHDVVRRWAARLVYEKDAVHSIGDVRLVIGDCIEREGDWLIVSALCLLPSVLLDDDAPDRLAQRVDHLTLERLVVARERAA